MDRASTAVLFSPGISSRSIKIPILPTWGKIDYVPHKPEIINWDTWWCCNHCDMLAFQVKLLLTWAKVRISSYTGVGGKALVACQGHRRDMLLRQYYQLQTNRLWAVLLCTINNCLEKGIVGSSNSSLDIKRPTYHSPGHHFKLLLLWSQAKYSY